MDDNGNIDGIYKACIANISIDIYGYSLYSPDIFHICFLDMFHVQGGIFPCVFLNLWSQEKISPYSKTTFLLLKFQVLQLLYFY